MDADDHQAVAVELLHAGALIGHHLAQLRQDQIDYLGTPSVLPSD